MRWWLESLRKSDDTRENLSTNKLQQLRRRSCRHLFFRTRHPFEVETPPHNRSVARCSSRHEWRGHCDWPRRRPAWILPPLRDVNTHRAVL
jgi:hypothetical protein